jgi:hypothetical protein
LRSILLEDKLSSLTETLWLMFAPIIIAFAFFSARRHSGSCAGACLRRPQLDARVRDTIPLAPPK